MEVGLFGHQFGLLFGHQFGLLLIWHLWELGSFVSLIDLSLSGYLMELGSFCKHIGS